MPGESHSFAACAASDGRQPHRISYATAEPHYCWHQHPLHPTPRSRTAAGTSTDAAAAAQRACYEPTTFAIYTNKRAPTAPTRMQGVLANTVGQPGQY